MAKFFKTFGKGILYVFGLPILVVFLAVYLVISIFGFIFTGFKALILFFKGESINGKTSEDIEAEQRMELMLNPIPHVMEQIKDMKQQQIDMQQKMLDQAAEKAYQQIAAQQNMNNRPMINANNPIDVNVNEPIQITTSDNYFEEEPMNEEDIPNE